MFKLFACSFDSLCVLCGLCGLTSYTLFAVLNSYLSQIFYCEFCFDLITIRMQIFDANQFGVNCNYTATYKACN